MPRSDSDFDDSLAVPPLTLTDRRGSRAAKVSAPRFGSRILGLLLAAGLLTSSTGCVLFELIFGPSEPEVPEGHDDPLGPSDSGSETLRCPVTGALVHPDSALAFVHNGKTYYLRDTDALEEFKRDPHKYVTP